MTIPTVNFNCPHLLNSKIRPYTTFPTFQICQDRSEALRLGIFFCSGIIFNEN
ncbi:hypothetical protein [Coleofasciculus sp.]|uniref:hypothetical protein n=1 Tax=Coleofasciculus sp. TaxID=3100458 RepID=UPI003A47220E